ncbi:MAG: hypothetical protein RL208_699 [Pseudomonadota bacterium]|jgi:Mg2+/Co2+ transporter CorB
MGPSSVIFALVLLLLLSTFFSLSEAAFIAVSEEKVFKLNKNGVAGAKRLMYLLGHKERVVSVCLLFDNVVNIIASSVSALFFSDIMGEQNSGYAIMLSSTIMTILIFIFGEVLPKTIGIRIATTTALIVAPIFQFIIKVGYPIVYLIEFINNKLISALKINNESDNQDAGDTILGAVEMYHQKGSLEEDEKAMLSSVLMLEDVDIKDVMTHRSDMIAFDINNGASAFLKQISSFKYSKIPIYDGNDDNMLGYIVVRDFLITLHNLNNDPDAIELKPLIKEPWFIPGDASLSSKIKEFRKKGNVIAFVVDEYGGIMGMVTLEDILEQIVGDIYNEEQEEEFDIVQIDENVFKVKAEIKLEELNDKIGSDFRDGEVSSFGGYIINRIENIPNVGDTFDILGYRVEVLSKKMNRLLEFKIQKIDSDS